MFKPIDQDVSAHVERYAQRRLLEEARRPGRRRLRRHADEIEDEFGMARFLAGARNRASKLIFGTFLNGPAAYHFIADGGLNSSNKANRELFEGVTGIKLPETSAATKALLIDMLGEEVLQLRHQNPITH